MIIWLETGAAPPQPGGHCRFGRLSRPAAGIVADDLPLLVEVRSPADVAAAANAAAWHVAPGRTLDIGLLAALAATGREALVSVNGLGERGLAMLREAMPADRLVLVFDASGTGDGLFFEQLAWLSRQAEKFAVAADRPEQFCSAALAGAHAVLAPSAAALDVNALDRVLAAQRPGAARPVATSEVDRLAGRELCLTVARPMRAGQRITEDDLAVAVTEYRGLAPTMRSAAVGRTLRYAVEPGEAIHFGHLA